MHFSAKFGRWKRFFFFSSFPLSLKFFSVPLLGLSPFSDILGTVFFMGKRNGRYVSGNMLHGAMLMIFDAAEEFGSDDDCSLEFKVFEKLASLNFRIGIE